MMTVRELICVSSGNDIEFDIFDEHNRNIGCGSPYYIQKHHGDILDREVECLEVANSTFDGVILAITLASEAIEQ